MVFALIEHCAQIWKLLSVYPLMLGLFCTREKMHLSLLKAKWYINPIFTSRLVHKLAEHTEICIDTQSIASNINKSFEN